MSESEAFSYLMFAMQFTESLAIMGMGALCISGAIANVIGAESHDEAVEILEDVCDEVVIEGISTHLQPFLAVAFPVFTPEHTRQFTRWFYQDGNLYPSETLVGHFNDLVAFGPTSETAQGFFVALVNNLHWLF